MRCLPFSLELYRDLQNSGLDAASLWADRRRYGRNWRWPRHADALEEDHAELGVASHVLDLNIHGCKADWDDLAQIILVLG